MSHCFLGGFSPWAHPWAGIAPAAVRYEPLARFYPRLLHPKAQLQIAGGGEHTTGTLLGIPGPNVSPPPRLSHTSYPAGDGGWGVQAEGTLLSTPARSNLDARQNTSPNSFQRTYGRN